MTPTITLTGAALLGTHPELLHPATRMAAAAGLPQAVKLGRRRPLARPQCLRLSAYLKPMAYQLPALPVDWATKAAAALARMYLNDRLGCCVISDTYHRVGVWTGNATGTPVQGTDEEVLATYRIWNPGNQDNGCVITQVLDYCRDHGVTVAGVNHTVDGYVAVDWTNWDEVLVACFLFACLPLGINLPQAWTQSAVWDVTNTPILGGHDVPAIAVPDASGVSVASWGRTYKITKAAFTSRQWLEEAYAVLSPDWYAVASKAPNLIAADDLRSDLAKLGGGTIPDIGPGPTPPPVPPPPPPAVDTLFTLTLRRPTRAGQWVTFRAPVSIPTGTYAWDTAGGDAPPHFHATPGGDVTAYPFDMPQSRLAAPLGLDWGSVSQWVVNVWREYSPFAEPILDHWIDSVGLPAAIAQAAKNLLAALIHGSAQASAAEATLTSDGLKGGARG